MFANKVKRTQIFNPILMFRFAFVLAKDKSLEELGGKRQRMVTARGAH